MTIPIQKLEETIDFFLKNRSKGILAADESIGTIGKRFAKNSIESTFENRREYRELLFTTPGIEQYISGVIFSDETIHQVTTDGVPFVELLEKKNIAAGIKVDRGTIPVPSFPGETITEGLDSLRDRLSEYKKRGARFAKWRAVLKIGKEIPSDYVLSSNAQIMSRYASICQENGLVPIVEPEVLMDGNHTIEQCEQVTRNTLETVFYYLHRAHADFEMIFLKPNMALPGKDSSQNVSSQTVAEHTLSTLRHTVPPAIPVIAFLSGGQSSVETTKNLNAICMEKKKNDPWFLTFSFSRALQEEPLALWSGKNENKEKAQQIFLHRAKCNSSALEGHYSEKIESQ